MSVPPQEETGGFSLIVTVTVQPDNVQGEPNKVKWVETWSKSLEAVMADQGNKEYMKAYKEATNPLLVGEPQWELLKRFGGEWARAQEGVYQKP
ncbi:hypothetical protein F5883DRAFT_653063 [Diaporthe sp. PMI_573]|nr:hypothetical protein F5883DRAFT_653063 [Diaporthaceae sp. PMI_573]